VSGACRSFTVRSDAVVSTGAEPDAREVERLRERQSVEVPDRDQAPFLEENERVLLRRVQLVREPRVRGRTPRARAVPVGCSGS
jgi:hypothetical protein